MQGANWLASALPALGELARELDRMSSDAELAGLFDIGKLRGLLENWPSGGWSDIHQGQVYRDFLTTAICTGRWARRVRNRDCAPLLK